MPSAALACVVGGLVLTSAIAILPAAVTSQAVADPWDEATRQAEWLHFEHRTSDTLELTLITTVRAMLTRTQLLRRVWPYDTGRMIGGSGGGTVLRDDVTVRALGLDSSGLPWSRQESNIQVSTVVAGGWPWRTMLGSVDMVRSMEDADRHGAWELLASHGCIALSDGDRENVRAIPLAPMPLRFGSAWLMWTTALYCGIRGPQLVRKARHRVRERRGRCVECGYILRCSPTSRCSECGERTHLKTRPQKNL